MPDVSLCGCVFLSVCVITRVTVYVCLAVFVSACERACVRAYRGAKKHASHQREVVTAAHEHLQLQRNRQCIGGLLNTNKISSRKKGADGGRREEGQLLSPVQHHPPQNMPLILVVTIF
ncbi:hypothetical protein EVAR_85038_1 [Eumeta japonica]|uniref:Uncharacterized protein n=1 Tax=Eumeta variegata TaxID=151549 RepID=A0A4C1W7U4_EUMVA|nr:hypothetical protein EVAR_85038_1 [Eumeta japonica]